MKNKKATVFSQWLNNPFPHWIVRAGNLICLEEL